MQVQLLKKAMGYIFAVHIPIAGMAFFPVIFQLPVVLLPAHIAFLELIIDPACSTVFEAEPEEEDIMKKPPRDLKERLFSRKTVILSFFQGLSVFAAVYLVFLYSLFVGKSGDLEARTLAFATLVFANLMLIITNLSWKKNILEIMRVPNKALWWVIGGVLIALFVVLYIPFFRDLFHFDILHWDDLLLAFAGGVISLIWFEGMKMTRKK